MALRIVGNISGYHGVKGEIKIYPLVDDKSLFNEFKFLVIDGKNYQIKSSRAHKDFVLVTLEGVDNLNQAENIRGEVLAELEEELEANQFYISDIIGLPVLDQEGREIGTVSNYSNIGQKLVFIRLNEQFAAKSELLVPFVEEYIIRVSPQEKIFQINLTEELLELCK